MPAVTSLTLTDSTAAARTFAGRQIQPSYSKFEYVKYPDLRGGNPFVEVTWSDSSANRKTVKQGLKITLPMVRTINTVNTVVGSCIWSNGNFTIPDDATALEAADISAYAAALLANTSVQAGVRSRDPLY